MPPTPPIASIGPLGSPLWPCARSRARSDTKARQSIWFWITVRRGSPTKEFSGQHYFESNPSNLKSRVSKHMGGVGLALWLLWIPRTVIGWESESLPNGSLVETAFSKHGRQGGEDPPTWGWELPKPFPDKPPPPAPPDSFLQKLGRNPTDSFFERFVTHQGPLSALWGRPGVHWPRNFIPADNEVPFDGSTLQ